MVTTCQKYRSASGKGGSQGGLAAQEQQGCEKLGQSLMVLQA